MRDIDKFEELDILTMKLEGEEIGLVLEYVKKVIKSRPKKKRQ